MKHILIAGCGDVGTALGELLFADGHVVWGLRRRPDLLPPCIRPVAADLVGPNLHCRLPRSLTHVVYTAAADQRSDQAYVDAYVKGLDNLLDALGTQDQPIERVIFTSSTAVYGQSAGQWVDEEAPTEAISFAGRRLLEAEQRLSLSPHQTTILRLAGIYGPNRTRLLDRVDKQEARLPLAPYYTNRIHRDDCAGALRHLIALEAPDPVYLGVDHDPADLREVLRWLADQLGVPLRSDQTADDGQSRLGQGANKRCCNRRLVRSGYVFGYPCYRDGYGPMVRAYRGRL